MANALIVVDVQNDFCEGGSLAVAGGNDVAERLASVLTGEPGYDYVIATRDHHIDPGDHFSEAPDFVDSWPRHCVAGTAGAEFNPALVDVNFDAVFDKGEYSAAYSGFEGKDHNKDDISLEEYLRSAQVTDVDICGIATDFCVAATVADAKAAGFDTTVLVEFCAAVDPGRVPQLAAEWADQGIWIATSE